MKKLSFYTLILFFTFILFSCNSGNENTDETTNNENDNTEEVIEEIVEPNTFTDKRDNQVYKTVEIDGKTWLAENFAYKEDEGCWAYENNENNVDEFGYLYNWGAAMRAVPAGWHLPTKEEFESLIEFTGGGENAFEALIEDGSSGFNAVYSGWYDGSSEPFAGFETNMSFWSSTEHSQKKYAFYLDMFKYDQAKIGMFSLDKTQGYSVRLIKD